MMIVAFSFTIDEEVANGVYTSWQNDIDYELRKQGFRKEADYLYISNKSDIVLCVVAVQNIIKKIPKIKSFMKNAKFYLIKDVIPAQVIFNGDADEN